MEPLSLLHTRDGARPEELGEVLRKTERNRPCPPLEPGGRAKRSVVGNDAKEVHGPSRSTSCKISPARNRLDAEEPVQVLMIEVEALELVPHRVVVRVNHAGARLVDDLVSRE